MRRKVTIPENYNDITLGEFQKLRALSGDDDFVTIKTIEILTGVEAKDALNMRAKDRDVIISELSEALKHQPTELIRTFELNGIKFGFVPNLDDITFGEFLDLEN